MTVTGTSLRRLSLATLLCLAGTAAASAQGGLPGGASSLNETHGDWTVVCATQQGAARCAMTQTHVGGENRQRVLAVELSAAGDGGAGGMLVLPFGLQLDAGVRLAIDEAPPHAPLRFSTCLPAGCLAPFAFDAATVTALKAGKVLSVTVTANDGGQELVFSVSLDGFTSALARLTGLGG